MIDLLKKTFPIDRKNIGIKMSGGVDSSIVAFLLAKFLKEENINAKLYPIVMLEEISPFQEIFVKKILPVIEELTKFKFEDIILYHITANEDKETKTRFVEKELSSKLDLIVSGTNHQPKNHTIIAKGFPGEIREGLFPYLWDDYIYTPVMNIDKKEIAEIYQEYNLTETLFPLTRSCTKVTTNFDTHCGECWWCHERKWGFGRL